MKDTADPSTLRQFREFARLTGLPVDHLLDARHAEIMRTLDAVERLPAAATPNILEMCAHGAMRPGLGVAFAEWINLRRLGPLSLLWDHCGTLSEAMRVSQRYLHLESAAVGLDILDENNGEVALVHNLQIKTAMGGSQFLEATLASSVRVARLILGESWVPLRIEFAHSAGEGERVHRKFFRSPLQYRSERYAIICSSEDFTRRCSSGNPQMLHFVEAHLNSFANQWPQDLCGQVEHLVQARLAGGHATLSAIAGMMAMSQRTLQRRLAAEGTDFASVLDKVRMQRAQEYYFEEKHASLTQLAYLLGYSDASAASRFLREKLSTTGRRMQVSAAEKRRPTPDTVLR